MEPYRYYRCMVPMCTSTTVTTPNKEFIRVPNDKKRRLLWLSAVGRDSKFSDRTVLFVCEDHFDLPNDMENYMEFKMMNVRKFMKKNAVPHIFDCQRDWKKAKTARKLQEKSSVETENPGHLEELQAIEPTPKSKMARQCFVPNCKSGYDTCPEKVSLFKSPIDTIDLWNNAIPGDRTFTKNDKLCSKHFLQEDIVIEHVSAGGQTKVPYERSRLKKLAIPSIFPDPPPKKQAKRVRKRTKPIAKESSMATTSILARLLEKGREKDNIAQTEPENFRNSNSPVLNGHLKDKITNKTEEVRSDSSEFVKQEINIKTEPEEENEQIKFETVYITNRDYGPSWEDNGTMDVKNIKSEPKEENEDLQYYGLHTSVDIKEEPTPRIQSSDFTNSQKENK